MLMPSREPILFQKGASLSTSFRVHSLPSGLVYLMRYRRSIFGMSPVRVRKIAINNQYSLLLLYDAQKGSLSSIAHAP